MCFGNTIFSLTATLDLDLIFILSVQFSQGDLPPLRPPCGEAPGRDSNPERADLVSLTTKSASSTEPLLQYLAISRNVRGEILLALKRSQIVATFANNCLMCRDLYLTIYSR